MFVFLSIVQENVIKKFVIAQCLMLDPDKYWSRRISIYL